MLLLLLLPSVVGGVMMWLSCPAVFRLLVGLLYCGNIEFSARGDEATLTADGAKAALSAATLLGLPQVDDKYYYYCCLEVAVQCLFPGWLTAAV